MTFDLKDNIIQSFLLPVEIRITAQKEKPTDCEVIETNLKGIYIVGTLLIKNRVIGKFAIG